MLLGSRIQNETWRQEAQVDVVFLEILSASKPKYSLPICRQTHKHSVTSCIVPYNWHPTSGEDLGAFLEAARVWPSNQHSTSS